MSIKKKYIKKEEIRKLIRCGKFQNGYKMHTFPDCGGEEKMFNL